MEALLIHSQKVLAEQFSRHRKQADPLADWYDAEDELVSKQAYFRAQKLPEAAQDQTRNWQEAKGIVVWRKWLELNFPEGVISPISRPYLALASHHRSALAGRLHAVCSLPPHNAAGLISVLDGGPECARLCSGEQPCIEKLTNKDSLFYDYSRHTMALFRAKVLEAGSLRSCYDVTSGDRAFEDGGIFAFQSAAATCDALTAALHLRGYLADRNFRSEFHWQEALHARSVVASNWDSALRGLQYARRDEIVVEDTLFSPLEAALKRTLLSAGVRLMKSTE